jgi:DNA-binding CsgD family transcriptional regulator
MRLDDVAPCLPMLGRRWVHPALAQAELLATWLREGRLVARVFEEAGAGRRPGRLRGCGLSVPVPLALAERACAGAVSPLVGTVMANAATLTLDRRRQAEALGQHSLCMLVLGFALDDAPDASLDEVNAVAQAAFVQAHAGYALRCLLGEVDPARAHAGAYQASMLAMGCRQAPMPPGATTQVLYLADHHLAASPFHVLYALFRHQPRRWRFTAAQQALLEQALAGIDDAQAAQALGVSLHTVHKRWRAIYTALDDDAHAWSMLGLSRGGGAGTSVRGVETRRRLLDYLKGHPEELRPWPPAASCAAAQARVEGQLAHLTIDGRATESKAR